MKTASCSLMWVREKMRISERASCPASQVRSLYEHRRSDSYRRGSSSAQCSSRVPPGQILANGICAAVYHFAPLRDEEEPLKRADDPHYRGANANRHQPLAVADAF